LAVADHGPVDEYGDVPAERRLFDAVAEWMDDTTGRAGVVIGAACDALVRGLDSPALRELAGASVTDVSEEISDVVERTLGELNIPYPGSFRPGFTVASGGGVVCRPAADSLRLEVVPAREVEVGGFQVLVYVNDVEVTAAGAGLGMDPYDLLVPANRLVAIPQPSTVPIARCTCGVYGCGATDVTIVRDGDRVHWDWSVEAPMNRGVTFPAGEYDTEVARMAADHSWETPQRTAGRLVLTNVDRDLLQVHALTPSWAANHHRNPLVFRVALQLHDQYQIFVDTPWLDRSAEELASEVCATLALPPDRWHASWHAIRRETVDPPAICGPAWSRQQYQRPAAGPLDSTTA
jgi:hypothetical protein